MFLSTKTYSPEQGLSCAFRQWKATHSHCSKLHGYALGFKFTFAASTLDDRNWVVDFGGLKGLKEALANSFDHKVVLAYEDPLYDRFCELENAGALEIFSMHRVGCEAFAEYACQLAAQEIEFKGMASRVWVASVECFEHSGNSAIFIPNTNLYPGFPDQLECRIEPIKLDGFYE